MLPALLLIACLVSWSVAHQLSEAAPARAVALASAGPDFPLASLNRLPSADPRVAGPASVASLINDLATPPSPRSCAVVLIDGEEAVSVRSNDLLVPGPAQMLVTGWAALDRLGGDYRFSTSVQSEAPPSSDGVVAGSLFLVGGGDPVMMTAEWARAFRPAHTVFTDPSLLADAVVDAGVVSVLGSVIGVEDRYDQVRSVPASPAGDGDEFSEQLGPLGALRFNAATLAASNPTPIDRSNPAGVAAATFDDLLEARGVTIAGLSRSADLEGERPELVEIASLSSAPLSQIVNQMLEENDVAIAELLMKELGVVLANDGSSVAGAKQVLAVTQESLGIDLGAPPPSASGAGTIGTATCATLAAVAVAIDNDTLGTAARTSYHSASLGNRPADALVVRGQIGTALSVIARAPLSSEPDPVEVVVVAIINNPTGPSEADRAYVRQLIASIDELRSAFG